MNRGFKVDPLKRLLKRESNDAYIRLPDFIVPSVYHLEFHIDLEEFEFSGHAKIDLNVCFL
jgi:hypothetical protein